MELIAVLRKIRACEGETAAQLVLEYAIAEAVAVERERCYELAAEEQLYPNDADCSAVNGVVQRIMTRIENGTTIDDLRSNAGVTGAEPKAERPR